MLVILAGITLNAVIGEDGIIFQAKDTKNMITNETTYDNEQLAALQNELRDNGLYSGIGIIPGTDTGGSSEGGESGSGGGGNQGGNQEGGSGNENTGGNQEGSGNTGGNNEQGGGVVVGGNAVPPTITVIDGNEIASGCYDGDVTVQLWTADKTLKIKYILNTTVDEINDELYPSGLVRELEIENGGTLTFTKDGEYSIRAYSYDVRGNKSSPTTKWIKRESGTGISVSVASGTRGENDWYTSNISINVLSTEEEARRVTYRVSGTLYSNGMIGDREYTVGNISTGEVEIGNGETFRIAADGEFEIIAYSYGSTGARLSQTSVLKIKRDASNPYIRYFEGEQIVGEGFRLEVGAEDYTSNLARNGTYTYRYKTVLDREYTDHESEETSYLCQGLQKDKTYDICVVVKDEAGNRAVSDLISRPAIYVSNDAVVGSVGTEGSREYYRSDVDISLIGQEGDNVGISKVTYQIIGTTTSAGVVDDVYYDKGVALSEEEKEIDNRKIVEIKADGNWVIKLHTYNAKGEKVSSNTAEITRNAESLAPPIIEVAEGTEGESSYYRSNIMIRLTSENDAAYERTTYTVTGTATGSGYIGGVAVTSGQEVNISETNISNGGTFAITADGTWTIKGYTYGKEGSKSVEAEGITVTRDMVNPSINTPTIISGTEGEENYYRSNVTLEIAGSDATSPIRITYQVTGTGAGVGQIGEQTVLRNQEIDTGEVEIENNGTFPITADGKWTVTARIYDKSGRSATSSSLVFTKDTVMPIITSFAEVSHDDEGMSVQVDATDGLSGLATTNTYQYFLNDFEHAINTEASYKILWWFGNYGYPTAKVVVSDKAGNKSEKSFLTNYTAMFNNVQDFSYTGNVQTFTNILPGKYKLEVWGAQGGGTRGGKGAYASSIVSISSGKTINIIVGQQGGLTSQGADYCGGGRRWIIYLL